MRVADGKLLMRVEHNWVQVRQGKSGQGVQYEHRSGHVTILHIIIKSRSDNLGIGSGDCQ